MDHRFSPNWQVQWLVKILFAFYAATLFGASFNSWNSFKAVTEFSTAILKPLNIVGLTPGLALFDQETQAFPYNLSACIKVSDQNKILYRSDECHSSRHLFYVGPADMIVRRFLDLGIADWYSYKTTNKSFYSKRSHDMVQSVCFYFCKNHRFINLQYMTTFGKRENPTDTFQLMHLDALYSCEQNDFVHLNWSSF